MSTATSRPVHASRHPVQRPPLAQMSPDELRIWLQQTQTALRRKMRRERAYLERRAARGVHTATDDGLEQDQGLEADLLALLEEIAVSIAEVLP